MVKQPIFNATLVNLTLMALVSSSPLIILNIYDTCWTWFESEQGQLGPQSIIGSGAFNFLVVAAISLAASNKEKRLQQPWFFWCTAAGSLLAYGWIYYCLNDNVISYAEAGATLGLYFAFIVLMYVIDVVIKCVRKESSSKPDATWGLTHFSVEEMYEVNLSDQIGAYSRVPETKWMTEYVRDFLINPAHFEEGNSKIQYIDYSHLKQLLQGSCMIERL